MVALRVFFGPLRRTAPPILPTHPAETLLDGSIDGQFYRNRFFRFTIPIPWGWLPLSADELTESDAQMIQAARQLHANDSAPLNPTVHSHNIFGMRRKSDDDSGSSPALVILAEPDAGSGEQKYLNLVRLRLEQVPHVTLRANAPYVLNAKNATFHSMDIDFSGSGEKGIASFHAISRKGYVLAAILHAPDAAALAELKQIVNGMEF